MGARSKIEWTDHTFNPWIGCTKISLGCDNCYAEVRSKRTDGTEWGAGKPRIRTSAANWKQPVKWNAELGKRMCEWEAMRRDSCEAELVARGIPKPRRERVFCASLADVFDNEVDPQWRSELFALIASTPNLDWLLLTKRIGNVTKMIQQAVGRNWDACAAGQWKNLWIGATICNQEEADRDLTKLLNTPAALRFVSIEPMLGRIDLTEFLPTREWDASENPMMGTLDWVICGGESGPKARPMHPGWARSLRDQCAAAGVPFLFKQWGEWAENAGLPTELVGQRKLLASGDLMIKVGKKSAGRLLDGVEHNGVPV